MGAKSIKRARWERLKLQQYSSYKLSKEAWRKWQTQEEEVKKSNVKSKAEFHFQGDSEKRWWKSPSQTTQCLQNEKQKKDYMACWPIYNRSIIVISALASHLLYFCLWCWGALNCSYCSPKKLFTRAERKTEQDVQHCACEPCFTPLQTSHKTVNKPTGGKRTALCWSSYHSIFLLCASQKDQLLDPTTGQNIN